MSALFNFETVLYVLLLIVCSATYLRQFRPTLYHRDSAELYKKFLYKCSVVGDRLSPWVSICCLVLAFRVVFVYWRRKRQRQRKENDAFRVFRQSWVLRYAEATHGEGEGGGVSLFFFPIVRHFRTAVRRSQSRAFLPFVPFMHFTRTSQAMICRTCTSLFLSLSTLLSFSFALFLSICPLPTKHRRRDLRQS